MLGKKHAGFAAISDSMTLQDGGWLAPIPDGWRQGRTAYGGLTTGLAYAAAARSFPELPPLRSANINFIGPVTGDAIFTASLLRKGRNVTTIKVAGVSDGGIIADIVFTYGQSRESLINVSQSAPPPPPPDKCKAFTPKLAESFVPKFFLRFDTKLIDGARPMAGAKDGYIRAWSRHKDKDSREGIASLLTLSDVLPPAALPMVKKMGPVSSVNFLLNIISDNPQTVDGWWQVETRLTVAEGGYSSQIMRIFNSENELVAEGIQAVALFI